MHEKNRLYNRLGIYRCNKKKQFTIDKWYKDATKNSKQ